MKTRALAVDKVTGKSKYVTAYDVIYLREFNKEFYDNLGFYYVDFNGDKNRLIPKYLKNNNTAFFAFESAALSDKLYQDEGETLTHFVAKKALSEMKELYLIDIKTREEYFFNISCAENEKRFDFEKIYFADVYCELDENQHQTMKEYLYKWKGKLILEVCVTHNVSNEKRNEFNNNGYPVFEIQIPKKTRNSFNLESNGTISKDRIDRAINNMKKMFEKGVRGVFISDPESEEYKIMMKYKDEIEKFKKARNKAQQEYVAAENRLESINMYLKTAENNKKYYEDIENKVEELENKIADLEKEIEFNKKHPVKHLLLGFGKGKD